MTWIQDAHRDWHTVNGKYAVCPLDCGVGETADLYDEPDPVTDEPAEDEVSWHEYGQAEAYADLMLAHYDDDPNPYHGDYSEW